MFNVMFLCYIVQFAVSIVIVNGASKSKPQQYLSFFNGPQSFYLQQQATDTNSQKWYYSSNKKPIAYSWYWAVQDFPSSNFYKNTLPSKQNDRTVNWDCGRNQLANRFARIMGGQDAVPHSYPWMVSLAKRSLNNLHLCGGVLITRRHVLTAAHCMEDFNGINDLNVIVGAHYITDQRTSASVTAITTHPQYDPETFANDIAVITLRSSLSNNDPRIGIVCLPPDDIPGRVYPPMKASGVAIGWGTTFFGGEPSETLRQVILPILDPTTWPCNMYVTYVKGQICAGQLSGGADTCQADSGGPLMIENSNNRWEIVGITSFGKSCGKPNTPAIYTRVATYNNFIRSIIGLSTYSPSYSSGSQLCSFKRFLSFSVVLLIVFC